MKISARNVFTGKISAIQNGPVSTEVEITIAGGDKIIAVVTHNSSVALGLAVGKDVTALVKASSILVMTDGTGLRLSARNCLPGRVSKVTKGAVNTEVAIQLAGGNEIHAIITHGAELDLGLKEGVSATAVFKAPSVILGVPA
ncbi:MAG: TOBE domain-containing protein [Formivibrio sp.]|nr:TOBE domain-containing protein [Formivibrio sp.]